MKMLQKRFLAFLAAAVMVFACTAAPALADTVVGVGPDGSVMQNAGNAGAAQASSGQTQMQQEPQALGSRLIFTQTNLSEPYVLVSSSIKQGQ